MKKFITIAISSLVLFSNINVFASTKVSKQSIVLDNKDTNVYGYMINDNNYFKLRDVAALLSGTDSGFSVSYDSYANSIFINRKSEYTKTPEDLKPLTDSDSDAIKSNVDVFVDDARVSFKTYSIDGYNYFKLRELGKVIGFDVDFDEERGNVLISSKSIKPGLLVNGATEVNIVDYATSFKNEHQDILKKGVLDIKDFFNNIESSVLGTQDHGQVFGNSFYIKSKDVVEVYPNSSIYIGKFSYTPYIRITQKDKSDTFKYTDKFEVAKTLKSKGFDPTSEFEISLGTKSDDRFIVYSTFVYK